MAKKRELVPAGGAKWWVELTQEEATQGTQEGSFETAGLFAIDNRDGRWWVELTQEEATKEGLFKTGRLEINTPGLPTLKLEWGLRTGSMLLWVPRSDKYHRVFFRQGLPLDIPKDVLDKLREEAEQLHQGTTEVSE